MLFGHIDLKDESVTFKYQRRDCITEIYIFHFLPTADVLWATKECLKTRSSHYQKLNNFLFYILDKKVKKRKNNSRVPRFFSCMFSCFRRNKDENWSSQKMLQHFYKLYILQMQHFKIWFVKCFIVLFCFLVTMHLFHSLNNFLM